MSGGVLETRAIAQIQFRKLQKISTLQQLIHGARFHVRKSHTGSAECVCILGRTLLLFTHKRFAHNLFSDLITLDVHLFQLFEGLAYEFVVLVGGLLRCAFSILVFYKLIIPLAPNSHRAARIVFSEQPKMLRHVDFLGDVVVYSVVFLQLSFEVVYWIFVAVVYEELLF